MRLYVIIDHLLGEMSQLQFAGVTVHGQEHLENIQINVIHRIINDTAINFRLEI